MFSEQERARANYYLERVNTRIFEGSSQKISSMCTEDPIATESGNNTPRIQGTPGPQSIV